MTTRITKQLPPEIEKDFDALRDQVDQVHAYWSMIRDLFGAGDVRLELLSESAGNFFLYAQRSFLDSLILGLSRLTDRPGSGEREKLVLGRLVTVIGQAGDHDLARRLREPRKRIDAAVVELRRYRDTVLAHSDRMTAIGERPAVEIPVQSVEDALSAVRDLMNVIDVEFHDTTRMYESISIEGGVQQLISLLEDGHDFRKTVSKDEQIKAMVRRMQAAAAEREKHGSDQ